jgi:signal transduction histidine kinase
MPWVDALSDPQELKRCVRALVALTALPALWHDYDPDQITDSIATALVSILDADFVYARLRGPGEEPKQEVLRTSNRFAPQGEQIHALLLAHLPDRPLDQTMTTMRLHEDELLSMASVPVGFGGDAVLVAGGSSINFPTEMQRILLRIGSNEMAIALHRWRAETEEQRFAALVGNSSEFIGFATLDGWPQYLNSAGMKLVGIEDSEQVYRTHMLEFICEADRQRARDEILPLVMQTGRWVGELGFNHFQTGETVPFLVDWMRIDDPRTGKPMNHATVSRDLTVQKASEAQLRHLNFTLEQRVSERTHQLAETNEKLANEIIEREHADVRLQELQFRFFHAARLTTAGQMAAALAHELNQPLAAATASVSAAKRLIERSNVQPPDGVADALVDATDQILRAGQIINRLRDFLTRGETVQQMEDLTALVRETSEFALAGPDRQSVKLVLRFDPDASHVLCNRVQVQQVLVNLVRNAAEAIGTTRPGIITITTNVLNTEKVEVAVIDNGPGLPQIVLDRPFEAFISTKSEGMGLGLSICRSIVEAHGGQLTTEPSSAGGTIFRFTLARMSYDNVSNDA